MASKYYRPCEKLNKLVAAYFLMENEDISDKGFEVTIYPNGQTIMGIAYGKTLPVISDKGNTFTVPNPGVSGRYLHPVSIRFFDTKMLITIFKPFGCYYIFGIPEGIFQNKTIGLKSMGIDGYQKTVDEISKANSARGKIDLLETWLINTLAKNDIAPVGYTEYAFSRIISGGGKVPLKKILSDIHLNKRYLERDFNQYLGLPAKEFSEIVRFGSIANYLMKFKNASLYDLCEMGGFYDPSHLIKQFSKYAGTTPIRFLEKMLDSGNVQIETIHQLDLTNSMIS
jgi:AraC-like DNA-binding protein